MVADDMMNVRAVTLHEVLSFVDRFSNWLSKQCKDKYLSVGAKADHLFAFALKLEPVPKRASALDHMLSSTIALVSLECEFGRPTYQQAVESWTEWKAKQARREAERPQNVAAAPEPMDSETTDFQCIMAYCQHRSKLEKHSVEELEYKSKRQPGGSAQVFKEVVQFPLKSKVASYIYHHRCDSMMKASFEKFETSLQIGSVKGLSENLANVEDFEEIPRNSLQTT